MPEDLELREDEGAEPEPPELSRRDLLGGGALLAGLGMGGAFAWPAGFARAEERPGPGRGGDAYRVRLKAAELQRGLPAAIHETNGDEEEIGPAVMFSKCLPHNALGEVDPAAYALLRKAIASGKPKDFELIPLGNQIKLANPQAAFSFNLIGPDSAQPAIPPPPRFAGAEQAAEAVELYWQALVRDVPFADYDSHPLIAEAAQEMSRLADFRGPKTDGADGKVTPQTLFRGLSSGELTGPYVSQFLWRDVFFTPIRFEQKVRLAVAGQDYLAGYEGWLANQNGALYGVNRFEPKPRYIRTGRDLGEYVHRDFTYQAFLAASLILLKMGALPDGANPYRYSHTQSGFTTFGPPYLLYVLAIVTQAVLSACWYQKWVVHRRLRPEELAGRVENHLRGRAQYPLHAQLLESTALDRSRQKLSTALLPQAYPEGCPTHPAYPAGHGVIGGACVTALKAFFDESYVIPNPVVPSPDGYSLVPYKGPPLTVGGELDKLAANVGYGRNFAGIHWRTDMHEGFRFGEAVATSVLQELKLTGNEVFAGFSFQRFDGVRVTI